MQIRSFTRNPWVAGSSRPGSMIYERTYPSAQSGLLRLAG